ncbi:MAG TPA: FecR family protein [Vicinamibacterales bacterium]|nr:FecR family protein [Vicinamibacterales bacterium]
MTDGGLSELLKLAGRRAVPDEHHQARARAAAHAEWKRLARRRRWRRSLWASPIAAAVVTAVLSPAWFSSHPAPTPGAGHAQAVAMADSEVATLQMVTGAITVTPRNGDATRTTGAGLRLRTGDRVETAADSRAMFVLPGGTIVKIDGNTRVSLDRGVVALDRGKLYVDADPHANDRDVVVRTRLATVRHLGTQFEVRFNGRAVVVRVREGEVAIDAAGTKWPPLAAGWAMGLSADLRPERDQIATYGPEWSWMAELPRPFTLEGSTLRAFLDWVSRELGRRWQYEDQSMRERFDSIVQRGPIEGLTAKQALAMVLEANELSFRETKEGLVIVRR